MSAADVDPEVWLIVEDLKERARERGHEIEAVAVVRQLDGDYRLTFTATDGTVGIVGLGRRPRP